MFTQGLKKLISRVDLSENETADIMNFIFSGHATSIQIAAFMAAMATKGETFEELAGAARSMRSRAKRIQVIKKPVVDTCGTGGDGAQTFNISTASAFVVAGAGAVVAKHGNRSVSSKCGSADVLEALGVNLEAEPELVEEAVNEIGIGFMFAPKFHGAMKYAAPVRKELGIRSIFNMLGPLTNPAAASCQLIGVFSPELTEMFASALNLLGVKRAFVVHGHDGLDEISICADTRVSELKDGLVRTYEISPEQFFGEKADPETISGGDAQENAAIIENIFRGEKGPKRNIILINSAAALVAADKAVDFKEGIRLAEESIDSGAAMKKLEALVRFMKG
ncbi:anthranilate phosphoribosyltransferase [Desulforegula conservatrix]|uniref:anthranilate phosphoribosyltransferase n=1 Tax=Desulforegula conservatrix TaxID=153026 RepID=UPI00040CFD73|nr:anthranilate phosphoribosyltransferase [Desulforegula conservatrix]